MSTIGHPIDPRRLRYTRKFGIVQFKPARLLTHPLMDQLDACKSIAARRLLLGIGKPRKAADRKAGPNGRSELLERKPQRPKAGGGRHESR